MILVTKPGPVSEGIQQKIRGGSWFTLRKECRSSLRGAVVGAETHTNRLGFRVILRKRVS